MSDFACTITLPFNHKTKSQFEVDVTEDYEGGTDKFIKNTGNKQLGGRNKSVMRKDRGYKSYYTPEMVKMVEEKCEWELETFEYSFMKNRIRSSSCKLDLASDRKIMKLKDIIKK